MVGAGACALSAYSRRNIPADLDMALQSVDGIGIRVGLDQHTNYSWVTFLFDRNSDWGGAPLVGKRPNGSEIET